MLKASEPQKRMRSGPGSWGAAAAAVVEEEAENALHLDGSCAPRSTSRSAPGSLNSIVQGAWDRALSAPESRCDFVAFPDSHELPFGAPSRSPSSWQGDAVPSRRLPGLSEQHPCACDAARGRCDLDTCRYRDAGT